MKALRSFIPVFGMYQSSTNLLYLAHFTHSGGLIAWFGELSVYGRAGTLGSQRVVLQ